MIGSEFSNRSKDLLYDLLLLALIVPILEKITSYLKENIPKYVNELYTKFNERHTPRILASPYQALRALRIEDNERLIFSFTNGRRTDFVRGIRYNRRYIPAKFIFLPILLPDFVEEDIEIPEDAICGITFERPDCRTSCGHFFCNDAVTTWLKQQQNEGRKMTCPLCRSIITKISLYQPN